MKQTLQIRLGQQLAMTPQLQQAIRLLQLPAAELNLEIREALESNLMLEAEEETEPGLDSHDPDALPETGLREPSEATLGSDAPDATRLGEAIPVDERWEDTIGPSSSAAGGDRDRAIDPLENRASPDASLQDHLLWQLELSGLSERDRRIGEVIVDAIADNGYLTEPPQDLLAAVPHDLEVEADDIQAVLAFIQHLDPIGVGAQDPREALRIQIAALPDDTPHRAAAAALITDHLEQLGQGPSQHAALRRQLGIDQASLEAAIALIQTLDPHPGSGFGDTRTEYIVPDCMVRRMNGRWEVEVNPEASPRLRVNDYYASLVRRGDNSADNHLMRQHLQEARWLIKSLRSRNETLQKVAECIVERQQGFLEHGEEAMQPLVLREVAEAIEMHESTVSRITTQKYMRTPQGTLEFKYFFSSHVQTMDGGECSATAIRARIRRLVAAETPARPLSDSRLADILRDEGINVARRTVAKYREVMGIASSTDRKRLG
ncbi:MAG: RNA polymerase factor sigma-54 [Spiribacter salinus]|uniref:RNA polymerase sigma-54 factor n=1 Tax=Spiribacter salinus TaxID=1335746 RepID=A0A540VNB9_9GAMM|nr:MAG: RNA polymerase factor sigma-54 [Spiribacter salinus]